MLYIRPENSVKNEELHKHLQANLEDFEKLLALIPVECTKFLFVIQPHLGKGEELTELLRKIAPYIYKTENKSEWPGTRLLTGDTAIVYYGHLTDTSKKILAEVGGFQNLGQPSAFEDFAILQEDEKWWMSSITHEDVVFVQ
jgi:hypothetical protein